MNAFQFVGVTCEPSDISEIEDAANSLLRDVARLDASSSEWLGRYSSRESVHKYGLWAVNGVTRKYRPYASHSHNLDARDDENRLVADWLVKLRSLIDEEVLRA